MKRKLAIAWLSFVVLTLVSALTFGVVVNPGLWGPIAAMIGIVGAVILTVVSLENL